MVICNKGEIMDSELEKCVRNQDWTQFDIIRHEKYIEMCKIRLEHGLTRWWTGELMMERIELMAVATPLDRAVVERRDRGWKMFKNMDSSTDGSNIEIAVRLSRAVKVMDLLLLLDRWIMRPESMVVEFLNGESRVEDFTEGEKRVVMASLGDG